MTLFFASSGCRRRSPPKPCLWESMCADASRAPLIAQKGFGNAPGPPDAKHADPRFRFRASNQVRQPTHPSHVWPRAAPSCPSRRTPWPQPLPRAWPADWTELQCRPPLRGAALGAGLSGHFELGAARCAYIGCDRCRWQRCESQIPRPSRAGPGAAGGQPPGPRQRHAAGGGLAPGRPRKAAVRAGQQRSNGDRREAESAT